MPRDEAELLREYLAERDVRCPVCKYNLRGGQSRECPECGARIDLRIGSIDLKLGPWLLCVFAVALPMGFSGVLAMIGLIGSKVSAWWTGRDWILLGVWIGQTILYGIALWVLVETRPRFLRKSLKAQWLWAWTLMLVMAAVQVVVVIAMNWLI